MSYKRNAGTWLTSKRLPVEIPSSLMFTLAKLILPLSWEAMYSHLAWNFMQDSQSSR